MSIDTKERKPRLLDINRAKGVMIPLVVFSHINLRGYPENNEWYFILNKIVTAFDMPLYMYLSGLLMFYSGAAYSEKNGYYSLIKKRAYRFLIPYSLMGFLVLFGKILFANIMFVDNKPASVIDGIVNLFFNTKESPASSLWYIYCIFIYCVALPPLMWVFKNNLILLFVVGLVMYPFELPHYMFLNKMGYFFLFFMMGGVVTLHLEKYLAFIDRWSLHFITLFLLSFGLLVFDLHWKITMLIIGTLSLPAIHGLVRMKRFNQSKLLLTIGQYSYVVYLFNTLAIGFTKGVMFHFMSWDDLNFLIFAPILFTVGLLAPIVLKRVVLSRIKFLDQMTT